VIILLTQTALYALIYVCSSWGLEWRHFDPKVLTIIQHINDPGLILQGLAKLGPVDLTSIQNVPAYIYTVLTKNGKTSRDAAVLKNLTMS
jgi:hypothetical protein